MTLRMISCPQYGCRPLILGLAKPHSAGVLYLTCPSHARSASARYGSSGTGFCDDSVLQGPVTCITLDRSTLISLASKSTSFHFNPNSSLILNPVPTSSSTRAPFSEGQRV